ncbi:glycosyltransferase family 4 protein [Oxalobacteraceae bacterium A2-2]
MTATPRCILVTCFAEGQPGFLDFSYRIRALAAVYDLTVISMAPLSQAELLLPQVRYVSLSARSGRLGWLDYLRRCARLIRAERPSVAVLLHSLAAPVALGLGGIPSLTYWNEHPTHVAPPPAGAAPLKAAWRALLRGLMFWGARRSSRVLPIGEAHRDDLLAHGCSPQRVQLQYMGVDPGFQVAERPLPARPVQLLYIGSVHPERGRDVMLEAMVAVRQAGASAHLTIVGASTEQLAYCRRRVIELGVADYVTVYGRVPGHEVPQYCARADVGLCLWDDLPWYRFNPPTKLFEYLVAGLPVLASNIRTHTAYISHGDNGWIFDYDAASLAKAIVDLCQDDAGLAAMQKRARASSKIYLWPQLEPAFLQHVQEVLP